MQNLKIEIALCTYTEVIKSSLSDRYHVGTITFNSCYLIVGTHVYYYHKITIAFVSVLNKFVCYSLNFFVGGGDQIRINSFLVTRFIQQHSPTVSYWHELGSAKITIFKLKRKWENTQTLHRRSGTGAVYKITQAEDQQLVHLILYIFSTSIAL